MSSKRSRKSKAVPQSSAPAAGRHIPSANERSVHKRVYEGQPQESADHLRFRYDMVDMNGDWCLHKISNAHHKKLITRLQHFEKMTVQQAREGKKLADYDMSDCPNQNAATRLANQYDGADSLTRLTIEDSGSLRLFGIREQNIIHIVWWDQNHEVWPEGKIKR